jgi:galactokinase
MMLNGNVYEEARQKFVARFECEPTCVAYAPGRVEVLGNHTDYNEGFVLSAAINYGTFFLAAPAPDRTCRLVAGDVMEEVSFDAASPGRSEDSMWSNYIRGVYDLLTGDTKPDRGFLGLFLGNIPIGSGLSSSAALEMSSGLCLADLYDIPTQPIDLAKIGQKAEHDYAGTKCGLLDQISSLYGETDKLVVSDFRSLDIKTVPLGSEARFVVCNTGVKHALVDGEYNERRTSCESAAAFFSEALPHPVAALRDVGWAEWEQHQGSMEDIPAKRAAHVIGENERVLKGQNELGAGKLTEFGQLMFESHESSIHNFENSCPELDFIVATARNVPGALGARLSGGGFGGSAVVLCHERDAATVAQALSAAYGKEYGSPCETLLIEPAAGAALVTQ